MNNDLDGDSLYGSADNFVDRHIGPRAGDIDKMLTFLGVDSLDAILDKTVPQKIRSDKDGEKVLNILDIGAPRSEYELLQELSAIADKNKIYKSMIGMGYYGTITPPAILRNLFENPLWYTPYTPYQAEIAQGRLEALLNFQTLVSDLTGMELANASLLDEPTAAAEAMAMCHSIARHKKPAFFASSNCHPQTLAVSKTRSSSLGIELRVGDLEEIDYSNNDLSGILLQYPDTFGEIKDYAKVAEKAHDNGALVVAATDLLALTLLTPPGAFGADIAVGSSQRFGVPLGFGGPHAAFMATREKYTRKMPGRIVGVSKDSAGNPAYRLSIQTREQHIKRDRATSNICTAQVLLAIMAGMYAVYHGPEGIKNIAGRVHGLAVLFKEELEKNGHKIINENFFDTLCIKPEGISAGEVVQKTEEIGINLRLIDDSTVGVSVDETTNIEDIIAVLKSFNCASTDIKEIDNKTPGCCGISDKFNRTSKYLTHPVFNLYHSEHELLRYLTNLASKDISLANSMIPLGSCTMKLNAAVEMIPVTWPKLSNIHPYVPDNQVEGYKQLCQSLEKFLASITGFNAISLQPNAGSQGEYAGLMAIDTYHKFKGQSQRKICLIPESAHGTNPASAVIAGFTVKIVACDDNGNINVEDLRSKAEQYKDNLGALMVTYPSTHGVFEESILEVCRIIHENGGQVYMDGANMTAQLGVCKPADMGADVCHLNLHKTFCIPHGGGGPGMGPIGVKEHLKPFLPADPLAAKNSKEDGGASMGAISGAYYGSPSILPISWMYIALMGDSGLRKATQVAILNANYMASKLSKYYKILYTGQNSMVAHEFILDCRAFEKQVGITVEDIAKRLIDFGFHAPTMSFPVAGTLMVEPTESESLEELDRFCDALIEIRQEIADIENGSLDKHDNPLKNAPHTALQVTGDNWPHSYSRQLAAYPVQWLKNKKYWPPVSRVDNAYGDRNLVCSCVAIEEYKDN